jgi:hypothetical protein
MDKQERGRQAQLILDSPTYQEAHTKFLHDIRSLRLAVGPRDAEGAHRLVLMEQAVEKAKRLFEMYLADAETARKELEKTEVPGPIGRLNRAFQRR